jgi:ubiquinone/menaquinone biosynthesis C-methylase UbiE
MGVYGKYILPRVVHLTCGQRPVRRQRQKVVPLASGTVLEIGFGSGLNLPYYDSERVSRLYGLEPSPEATGMARDATQAVDFDVEILNQPAEQIPLEPGAVDSVVVTYTLCTIPDTGAALAEMRRVLDSSGRLIFCEHGAAPDASVRRWQDRVDPIWKRLAGGCRLNRAIPEILGRAGFRVEQMETMYLPGWRPASFNYWGIATPV